MSPLAALATSSAVAGFPCCTNTSKSLKCTATGTNPSDAGYHTVNPCSMSKASQLTAVTVAANTAPGSTAGAGFDRPKKLAKRSSKDMFGMKARGRIFRAEHDISLLSTIICL